jgi:HSP20 family protein
MAYELTTWKPFRDLTPFSDFERMRREMDRLWGSFFEGTVEGRAKEDSIWLPSVDVSETKNDIVVKAELPGMDPKDIGITLSDGHLMIRGKRSMRRKKKTRITTLLSGAMGPSYGQFIFQKK